MSLFKGGVTDKEGRRGIFSHHISVDLDEYIKAGANPKSLEKYLFKNVEEYVEFVRIVRSKGRPDPIQIKIENEMAGKYGVEYKVENVGSKNTLKNILASLLRKERIRLLCVDRDAETLIKTVYALLEFLPPKQRVIQFCTLPVIKNESAFELITLTHSPFEMEWKVINIDKEMNFKEEDNIDSVAGYVVDGYFEEGSHFLKEFHTLWERIENRSKDLDSCVRAFVHEVIFAKYSAEDLLRKAKENFKNGRF